MEASKAAISLLLPSTPQKRSSPPTSPFTSRNLRNPSTISSRWRCSTHQDLNSSGSGDYDRRQTVEHLAGISPSSHSTAPAPVPSSSPAAATTPASPSSSHGLVLDLGPAGDSWDGRAVGSPVVKRFLSDEEERWFMWYHGRAAAGGAESVGLAVSGNGAHWERASAAVLGPSSDWWAFDTGGIRPSDVLVMSSSRVRVSTAVYWLYYTGFINSTQEEKEKVGVEEVELDSIPISSNPSFRALPGLAISQDGRHWARIEGEHHSGALLDVGAAGEWDSLFIAAPMVVYHRSGDLRMYYHSFNVECGCFCIGIARSRDGIRWVKLGKIIGGGAAGSFDEAGVLNGHVVMKRNGGYLMAYEGIDADGRRSIGLAESSDGLSDWRRCGDGPILVAGLREEGEDGWDCGGVGCPCLVRMDGDDEWRLYYRGIGKEGRTGIGMAVSLSQSSKFPATFRRWTGFHHT
ncbi:hypothetical protein MRB53_020281 [Persea americana]|uniref:Uncharacterized protein n=1 Tax=Persea americana TaxID=3435 RepID=A0ACC2L0I0_PERAE|nr:hypothetical protein MRB53_020281 [Persea americana]